ncbi:MAG: YesL family protein [Acholeplasmataceae bacterium]|nr:YesL family protein [Acholeplasmataceae bacterium]
MGWRELYRNITNIIYAGLLWLFTSLLGILLTFGAATTALFRVCFQVYRTKEPTQVAKRFFRSFKENFWISTLCWLIIIAIGLPLYMLYNYALKQNEPFLMVMVIVSAYELVMFSLYVFPIIAIFKVKNLWHLFRNTMIMANQNLWMNIKLLGSLAAVFLLVIFVHSVSFYWLAAFTEC